MTLDELKAFATIAETGSFTRASALLHRSQPAISRRIDLTEQELGAPLFERVGRRVVLTEAGVALLPHAEAALAAVQDGEKAVRARTGQAEGALTLAVVGTLADAYLVDVLRRFQAQHVKARVELQTANSREVSDLVRRGQAAIGLRYFPEADTRLETTPLGAERLYVVVPAGHPVKARRCKSLTTFADDRWLGFPCHPSQPESFGSLLQAQLIAGGVHAPTITEIDSLTAQKRLVEAGFGVALMPRRNVRDELAVGTVRVVEVSSLRAEIPVVLVQRRGGYRSPLATGLVELLRSDTPALLDGA